ncbi:MAG: hypothetical protein H7338_13400 [Candidatus Sericytochromatia bacterium]|nr:hypothetical protein [Candidatus Sericytochromatia bacterium]
MIADKNISAESLRFAKKNQLKRPGKVGDVVLNRQGEVFKLPDPAPSRENAENRPAGQAEAPSAHEPAKYTETADLHEALKELERDADPTQAHWDRTSAGKVAIVPDRHKAVIDGQEVEVHRKRWVAETDGAIAGANKRYGDYRQEENTEVYTVYHDDQTRQQYEVTADRLSDEDGQPGADVNGRKGTMGLDTPVSRHRGEHTFNADPERLPYTKQTFVLATTGQLYMASEHEASGKRLTANSGDLHHSSFLSGQPVAGAGELFLHADRTLAIVNNESGHYRPAAGLTRQVLQELTDRQVDLDNVRVNNRDNGAVYKGMAKEFMQGASQAGEGAWAQQRGKAPPRERTGEDMATLFRNRHAVTAQILSGAAARFFQQY